jgi:phage host-nuclease inhibitor protein Gam
MAYREASEAEQVEYEREIGEVEEKAAVLRTQLDDSIAAGEERVAALHDSITAHATAEDRAGVLRTQLDDSIAAGEERRG